MRVKLMIGTAVMLAACQDHTAIQKVYAAQRDMCQILAEGNIAQYLHPLANTSEEDRNAQLVTLFSDCMFTEGWTVATPERERSRGVTGTGASIRSGHDYIGQKQSASPQGVQQSAVPAQQVMQAPAPASPYSYSQQQPNAMMSYPSQKLRTTAGASNLQSMTRKVPVQNQLYYPRQQVPTAQ